MQKTSLKELDLESAFAERQVEYFLLLSMLLLVPHPINTPASQSRKLPFKLPVADPYIYVEGAFIY